MTERTLGQLVADATADVQEIVRAEIALAKAELAQDAKRVGVGAGMFGAAGYLGFLASIYATCLIACFASRRMGAVWALLLSAGVTVFAWGVFLKGLGLPFRAIGPSLGG